MSQTHPPSEELFAYRDGELDPECRSAVDSAGRLLEGLGHGVEISHPPALDDPEAVKGFLAVVSAGVACAGFSDFAAAMTKDRMTHADQPEVAEPAPGHLGGFGHGNEREREIHGDARHKERHRRPGKLPRTQGSRAEQQPARDHQRAVQRRRTAHAGSSPRM